MNSIMKKVLPFSAIVVLMVVFAFTTEHFFTWVNINNLLREVSIVGTVAIGMTFVMMGGGIDLSTGAICGLVMMLQARLLNDARLTAWLVVVIGIAVGLLCGLFNGFVVTKLRLGDFIATLASQLVFRGLVYVSTFRDARGNIVTQTLTNRLFKGLGGAVGGVYISTIVWLVLVVVSYVALRKTRFGTYTYACGTNRTAAALNGINVTRIKYSQYMISGVCAAVAGTFLLAWQGGTTLSGGTGMEFNGLVSVVVGGTALSGGVGDTVGTAAGSVFMVLIVNGIYKYGIPSEWQYIVKGIIILIVASYESIKNRIKSTRQRRRMFIADDAKLREEGEL